MLLSLEEVKTIYFNEEAMRLPDYRLGRIAMGTDGRLYYRFGYTGADSVELFNSLTTVIYQCTPMPYTLLEWYVRNGMLESKRLLKVAQLYGTLMHIEIGKFSINQEYDFDKIDQVIEDYLAQNSFWDKDCEQWNWRLRQDMIAWAEFVHEYKIQCLAVEMVLCSNKGFATAIDVVAKMDMPVKGFWGEVYKNGGKNNAKGSPKETEKRIRKTVLINMKSGRHGFYPNNGLQVEAERVVFEENFPDIKIDCILNWAPTDWESIDGDKFKMKDWTGLVDKREIECMFQLAEVKFRDKMQEKERVNIWGQVLYGNKPTGNISIDLLADIIKRMEIKKLNPDIEFKHEKIQLDVPVGGEEEQL